jgi:hypothetical protein
MIQATISFSRSGIVRRAFPFGPKGFPMGVASESAESADRSVPVRAFSEPFF